MFTVKSASFYLLESSLASKLTASTIHRYSDYMLQAISLSLQKSANEIFVQHEFPYVEFESSK